MTSPTLVTPPTLSSRELEWIRRAEALAAGGWGLVHPNPMVGCVIVKNDVMVGEGYHGLFGGPHAEVVALESAGPHARGATAYVSLEPCNHVGKTPPCAPALVAAGIARVVYGATDPGRESAGGGAFLSAAGVEMVGPVYPTVEARRRNATFFHSAEERSTYVAIKLAVSLDGHIARTQGERTVLTGPLAEEEVHRLRAGFDAIMIGSTTAQVDDPLLTVRSGVKYRVAPTRIVLDTRCRLTPAAALFHDVATAPVLVFTSEVVDEDSVSALRSAGATVVRVATSRHGLDLDAVMDHCWEAGIESVLCEGGGALASSLIEAGIARRLYRFVAPIEIGEGGVPAFPDLAAVDSPHDWDAIDEPTRFHEDVLTILDRGD